MPEDYRLVYQDNLPELEKMIDNSYKQGLEYYQQYGEFAGKAYMAGVVSKLAGHFGTATDAYELAGRFNKAWDTGNWDEVYGQVAKMAVSFAGGVGVGRLAGMLLASMGVSSVPLVLFTTLSAGLTVYGISQVADYIDSKISNGESIIGSINTKDLVVVGDIDFDGVVLLEAQNVTLIGKQSYEELKIESETLTVLGNVHAKRSLITTSHEYSEDREALTKLGKFSENQKSEQIQAEQSGQEAENQAATTTEENDGKTSVNGLAEQEEAPVEAPVLDKAAYARFLNYMETEEDTEHLTQYTEWLLKNEPHRIYTLQLEDLLPAGITDGIV